MADARFEDGGDRPLRLVAFDGDDLTVISGLSQDAVFPASEMVWRTKDRRFALLINRYRWEDPTPASGAERVQSLLTIEQVEKVRSQGVGRGDDIVLSVLSLSFEPGEDAAGTVVLTLAGDGAIAVDVEALEVTLRDVTRPYLATSGAQPSHPE